MTAPSPYHATLQSGVAAAETTSPQLDYSKVQAYWKSARPSMLGPYMMEGFGFPPGAGRFRFRGELNAVEEAVRNIEPNTSVLDLGSGVGVWTEYFAQRFAHVISVEGSSTLYEALESRCARYPNITTYNRDVLSFEPESKPAFARDKTETTDGYSSAGESETPSGFGLVFLGGLLMYLNDDDVRTLLRNLIPRLAPNALVLCRESTIRHGTKTLQGDYQVAYRSVDTYRNLLVDAGFDVVRVQPNTAYINVQMACELIKKWKSLMPKRLRGLPVAGRLSYWGLRLAYPWNTRFIPWLCAKMGCEFPMLTNHFFVLRPSVPATADRRDASPQDAQIEEEMVENAR